MNILIPHSWLLEHLDTQASPEDIQKHVSLSGPSIERIYDIDGEPVYDIEVTTNRVDSMSVRGIAREAAVILEQFGIAAKLKPLQLAEPTLEGEALPLPRVENDPQLNGRVTCVVLKDVKRTPTPDWMAQRLKEIEQNVHDSVIDITNYITHELGHPCHAFDYDKVMKLGGVIKVVEAQAGETFTTLDGNEFETVGGEVVFKNEAGEIIDLPAIKGTKNSSIDGSTQNVLLWIESIEPKKVRFASMTHAIRTVAAQLSEKNVDPELGPLVIKKGVELYQQLCEAQVASELYDDFPAAAAQPSVVVSISTIDTYLGLEIEIERIEKIMRELECQVQIDAGESRADTTIVVTPPSFRPDIRIPADVVEEIARLYGYHNLPSKLMDTPIPTNKPTGTNFVIENRVKEFLAAVGLQEVYTYSLVSEELAAQSGYDISDHLKLQNPLTDDRVYLRRTLIPSLEEVLDVNPQRSDLSVFEIANVYHPQPNDLPNETLRLSFVLQGAYRESVGVLESLFDQFYITQFSIQQTDKCTANIYFDTENIGKIKHFGTRTSIDIDFYRFLQHVDTHPTYLPLPKAEGITEDLTFTLPEQTQVGPIIDASTQVDYLVNSVQLKDVYKQNYTFSVIYLDPNLSISGADVEPVRQKLVELITTEYSGQLVGSIK